MRLALEDAGLSTDQIDYVNAHGTSTEYNDRTELAALDHVLGEHARRVPISSTKSMTGHLLGAAGALEAVFAVQAVRDRVAPPTINIDNLDPAVDLDIVRDQPRQLAADGDLLVLDNSFGFGGHNVALAFRSHA